MKASNLTRWGEFLMYIRCLSGGLMMSVAFTNDGNSALAVGVCGLLVSVLLTPILRVLGWRQLAERVDDAQTIPTAQEVENALRTSIADGLSIQEAVRFLNRTRGWDVMTLYPAVGKVASLAAKEAIRLVMSATTLAGSGPENQAG